MFALNTAFQAYVISKKENKPSKCQQTVNNCILLFDLGFIVFSTITSLEVVRIFPKKFLTKNKIVALQTTAFIIGALDLLSLIPFCYSSQANKKLPSNTPTVININNPEINNDDYLIFKTEFVKNFDRTYINAFSNENNPFSQYGFCSMDLSQNWFQSHRDNAFNEFINVRRGHPLSLSNIEFIAERGRLYAYKHLFTMSFNHYVSSHNRNDLMNKFNFRKLSVPIKCKHIDAYIAKCSQELGRNFVLEPNFGARMQVEFLENPEYNYLQAKDYHDTAIAVADGKMRLMA